MPAPKEPLYIMESPVVYWILAAVMTAIGVLLVAAPNSWFGPAWHYVSVTPAKTGIAAGTMFIIIGVAQLLCLHYGRDQHRILAALFFIAGFIYFTAGLLVGAAGLFEHKSMMEAPFMIFIGVHEYFCSSALWMHVRYRRSSDESIGPDR